MSVQLKEALVVGMQQLITEKGKVEVEDLTKLADNLPVSLFYVNRFDQGFFF